MILKISFIYPKFLMVKANEIPNTENLPALGAPEAEVRIIINLSAELGSIHVKKIAAILVAYYNSLSNKTIYTPELYNLLAIARSTVAAEMANARWTAIGSFPIDGANRPAIRRISHLADNFYHVLYNKDNEVYHFTYDINSPPNISTTGGIVGSLLHIDLFNSLYFQAALHDAIREVNVNFLNLGVSLQNRTCLYRENNKSSTTKILDTTFKGGVSVIDTTMNGGVKVIDTTYKNGISVIDATYNFEKAKKVIDAVFNKESGTNGTAIIDTQVLKDD